jgi:hypothetical protein
VLYAQNLEKARGNLEEILLSRKMRYFRDEKSRKMN